MAVDTENKLNEIVDTNDAEEIVVITSESHSGVSGLQLYYEQSGVYLSFNKNDMDANVTIAHMVGYIKRKEIQGVNLSIVSALISAGYANEDKIAPPQEEKILDADVEIRTENSNMKAWMILLPPDAGGGAFTAETLTETLKSKYKLNGELNKDALAQALQEEAYFSEVLIAEGKPVEDGVDGRLEHHYTLPEDIIKTKQDASKIDHREIHEFVKVDKGQVLITRIPATSGEMGYDVFGNELKPRPGKEVALPKGKNMAISEDKSALVAGIDGRLEMVSGTLEISPAVKIPGDVDMAVGNIDFAGDVEVAGNVNAGFTIRAAGNITVDGRVESAELYAGGDIILKSGINGGDKAVVSAGGSINVKYVERASLDAAVGITTEFALHSTMMSEGYIDVSYGKGTIIGGLTSGSSFIVAKIIGTEAGTATVVEIGVSPKKRARLKEVQDTLKMLDGSISRMRLALEVASRPDGPRSNPKVVLEVRAKLAQMETQRNELFLEQTHLEESMQGAMDGNIHVQDKIFRGAKIIIGSSVLQIRQDNQYVTYFSENKEITSKVFSYSKEAKQRS